MSDDLVAFLRDRISEDEAAAPELHEARVCSGCSDGWEAGFDPGRCDCGYPARVLREVEANRAILDRHMPHQPAFGSLACNWCSEDVDDRPGLAKERWPCPDIRSLASVWSDHESYRQEWKPEAAPE